MLTGLRSRKHIAPFDLVRPTSIDACLSWLSRGPRIGLMAGGLDLIDRMKFGQAYRHGRVVVGYSRPQRHTPTLMARSSWAR